MEDLRRGYGSLLQREEKRGRACVFELIFEGKINFDSSLMYNDMKIYSKSILNLK